MSFLFRYEKLYDRVKDKYYILNSETLERFHIKTAICENCDSVFEQTDVRCTTCNTARSSNNMRYFRQVGSKDIRID